MTVANALSFNELLAQFGISLRDTMPATTGTPPGGVAAIKVNRLIGNPAGVWNGAEVYFIDTAGMTADNPMVVQTSDAVGVLTLTAAYGGSPAVAGQRILLSGKNGEGFPFYAKINALTMALQELGAMIEASGSTAPPGEPYWATVPAALDSVSLVVAVDAAGNRTEYHPSQFAAVRRSEGKVYLPFDFLSGTTLWFYGRSYIDLATLDRTATINVSAPDVIRLATVNLTGVGGTVQEQRVAQRSSRVVRQTPRPNEVFIR